MVGVVAFNAFGLKSEKSVLFRISLFPLSETALFEARDFFPPFELLILAREKLFGVVRGTKTLRQSDAEANTESEILLRRVRN